MRLGATLTTFAAATALVVGAAAPASAGIGPSQACNDGVGYREVQLLSSPISLGVELYAPPTSTANSLIVCYSTTPYGAPGGIGGWIRLDFGADGSLTHPGVRVGLSCIPDAGTLLGLVCSPGTAVSVDPNDRPQVQTPSTGICLLTLNGTCAAYAPGLRVTVGGGSYSTIDVTILGVPIAYNLPAQCVAVIVSCP